MASGREATTVNLGGYLSIARRWWRTLFFATLVAALSGFVLAARIPPTYEAEALLLVGPINSDLDTVRAAAQLAETYAALGTSQQVLGTTIQRLGLATDPDRFDRDVTVSANQLTRTITIRVGLHDPQLAADAANSLGQELQALAAGDVDRPEGELRFIDPATPPTAPSAPQIYVIVGLTAMAGLVAAAVLITLLEAVLDSVKDRAELERLTVPYLATIPVTPVTWHPNAEGEILDVTTAEAGSNKAAVALDILTTSVLERADRPIRSLFVVGAQDDALNVDAAAHIAAAAASAGRRVALVDVSNRIPTTVEWLEPGTRDLTDVGDRQSIGQPSDWQRANASRFAVTGLHPDLFDFGRPAEVLATLLRDASFIVVHGAPLSGSPESITWARVSDAALIVVRLNQTKRARVHATIEELETLGVPIVGTILIRGARRARRLRVGRGRASAVGHEATKERPTLADR